MTRLRTGALVLLLAVAGGLRAAERPRLVFASIVGDLRGKAREPVHVVADDAGNLYLLMAGGRIAVFGADGNYRRSLRVPGGVGHSGWLALDGKRLLVGDWQRDFPWVFADRRRGRAPGRFAGPGPVAADDHYIAVADRGNRRLQVFARADIEQPVAILALPAPPTALTLDADQLLAVDETGHLTIHQLRDQTLTPLDAFTVPRGAVALCRTPGERLCVAFRRGRDQTLREYARTDGKWAESRVIAPSWYAAWPTLYPEPAPLTPGPDGEVWFATDMHGAILSLDPRSDRIRERQTGLHRPRTIAFGPNGDRYIAGLPPGGAAGPVIRHFDADGEPRGVFGPEPLYEADIAIWALLPAPDGGIHVRVVEPGYRKGWPAFHLKKVQPDGQMTSLLDLGSLYAVRTRFPPWVSSGNLVFDADGNIVVAAALHLSVIKLAPAGEVLWEASQYPRNADQIAFEEPVDLTVDSRGNIWVADARARRLHCLSPEGRLLLSHGGFADLDSSDGNGFSHPTGIAAITVAGQEYLVVGDSGNLRLVKFRLHYPDAAD